MQDDQADHPRDRGGARASVRSASTTAPARFLDLPFYQTGKVRKEPIGPADVAIVRALLEEVPPDLVFVAGDLSDPHGTHRMCKEAIDRALAEYVRPAAAGRKCGSTAAPGRSGR